MWTWKIYKDFFPPCFFAVTANAFRLAVNVSLITS